METYLSFLGISFLLIAVPGPSVLLIVSNSLARGIRHGLVTVAGTSVGMMLPLAVTTIGLGALASLPGNWLELWRWGGVLYLGLAGVRQLLTASGALPAAPARPGGAFWQGFLVSLANPATTPFFLAFLPQFVQPDRPALPQLALLSLSFLVLALLLDTLYALLAARLGQQLATPQSARWRQRLSGALLVGAALGLSLAR